LDEKEILRYWMKNKRILAQEYYRNIGSGKLGYWLIH